jgi:LCP family protein required for cell wall assembly
MTTASTAITERMPVRPSSKGGVAVSNVSERAFDDVFSDLPSSQQGTPAAPKRRRRWAIVLGALATVLLLFTGGGYLVVHRVTSTWDQNIERIEDPFKAIPDDVRPQTDPNAGDAVNILLLGSDSRVSAGDPAQWATGAQRTDAIMLLHLPANRKGAYLMSIPRDSWVKVPGHGTTKINAAFSWGGPTLMVQTVEQLTGVRINHLAIVDFDGFKQITDALGGVTITVPKTVSSSQGTIKAGTYTMDGETALTYVRQRYNLPGGDFDRVKRQQNWIRAVMVKLMSQGTLTNPLKLNEAMNGLTKALSIDDAFTTNEMRDLALSSRNLRPSDVKFFTVPVAGTGWSPDHKQSIVKLDTTADAELWQAVRKDQVGAWITTQGQETLGSTVR